MNVCYPLLSVAFEREQIPVDTMTPARVPDQRWRHIDKRGHGHFWDGDRLPTLEWVVTGKRWVGDEYDGDETDVGEYRCRLCAEAVEPRKRAEYGPRSISGPATFTVTIDGDAFRLTEQQYADAINHLHQHLQHTTTASY